MLLFPHLGGDHIAFLKGESVGRGQLQQVLERQGLLQARGQRRGGTGMGQEGIKLRQRHGRGSGSTTVLTVPSRRCRLAKAEVTPQTCRSRRGPMSRMPARPDAAPGLPSWMRWGGAGLTALLAVLFVVLLQQVRQQGQQLQALQERLQTLENAHDLERTNALEEQLRSTATRLQALERSNMQLEGLSSDNARLRREIQQLRRPVTPAPVAPAEPETEAPSAPTPPPPVRP